MEHISYLLIDDASVAPLHCRICKSLDLFTADVLPFCAAPDVLLDAN